MATAALLALADGNVFYGTAVGSEGHSVGEVVFNTSMTGYQEILTDPSYSKQLVALTYPHIGNTGTNTDDVESDAVMAAGLIIRDLPRMASNWRSSKPLGQYLHDENVVAIADIDTRALTRILRDKGAQAGCIVTGDAMSEADAIKAAQGFPGLAGMDLAKEVTSAASYPWDTRTWTLSGEPRSVGSDADGKHVVAMDFGVKQNILRMLTDRGCKLTVVPASATADEINALSPDGLFLSNGPGDPEPCDYAIDTIRTLVDAKIPTFGICLGHQLLGLASGAQTMKMKFGHHGANHPVIDTATGRVFISSQNHGFAIDPDTLSNNVAITHLSLFDQTLQGIRRLDAPAFSFQGHPEASPGPQELDVLFDQFVQLMQPA